MKEALLPLLCGPEQLAAVLDDPAILVVDLSQPEIYMAGHLPGAISLSYDAIVRTEPPVLGLLPATAQLEAVFGDLGVTPECHVVAYDDEAGGKASRLLWTLAVAGHSNCSLLCGGTAAWQAQGLQLSPEETVATPVDFKMNIDRALIADRAWILAHLNDPEVAIVDVRSAAEYDGRDRRASRGGHLPGAINIEWSLAVKPGRALGLPMEPGRFGEALQQAGVRKDQTVVVYCHSHHRSSHSYVALKALGYERVRGYPGSWSDWGNQPDTPIAL